MKAESFEARNKIALAISIGLAKRPNRLRFAINVLISSGLILLLASI